MIDPKDVDVRLFSEPDLDDFCDYWYRSPPEFWQHRALNRDSLPSEVDMRSRWAARFRGEEPNRTLTVFYKNERVGIHTPTHFVENESLIMHAHFFFERFRRRGIGTISYIKAMEIYFRDFGVKKIIFKTPLQNVAPLKIKEKLGLEALGEEVLDWPQVKTGTRARVFEVSPSQLSQIQKRFGL